MCLSRRARASSLRIRMTRRGCEFIAVGPYLTRSWIAATCSSVTGSSVNVLAVRASRNSRSWASADSFSASVMPASTRTAGGRLPDRDVALLTVGRPVWSARSAVVGRDELSVELVDPHGQAVDLLQQVRAHDLRGRAARGDLPVAHRHDRVGVAGRDV